MKTEQRFSVAPSGNSKLHHLDHHLRQCPIDVFHIQRMDLPAELEGTAIRIAQGHRRSQVHAHVEGFGGIEDQANGLLHLESLMRRRGDDPSLAADFVGVKITTNSSGA